MSPENGPVEPRNSEIWTSLQARFEKLREPWLALPAWSSPRPRLVFLAFLALFSLAYGYLCALQIGQINQNRASSDQQHNLELARESRGDLLPYRTSGVVNPLWPWLAGKTVVSADAEADAAAFLQGKWLNTGLTLAFCIGLGLWACRRLPLFPSCTLVALGGLGALAQRAPFFQPEPLFYVLFFLCTVLGAALLVRNTLPRYALFGAFCGLCYLAKASVTPFLGIVLALTSAAAILCLWPRLLFFWPSLPRAWAEQGFSWKRHWLGLGLVLGAFALVILPRGIYSQQHFGSPLHSFPKYWMWQDDFETESTAFMLNFAELRDAAKAGGKPLPSAGGYIKAHGWPYFQDRLVSGSRNALSNFLQPEDRPPWAKQSKKPKPWKHILRYRGYYLGVLGIWTLALGAATLAQRVRKPLADPQPAIPQAPGLILLGAGSFVAFTLAYGLYEVIGKGDRFMLSLYLPIVAAFIFAERRLLRDLPGRWPALGSALVHVCLLWAVCSRLGEITRFPFFRD